MVVTAGYIMDPLFLSRLKSIIQLSDLTMSNNVGTHLGYCIYLNKPHWIVRQKIGNTSHNQKHLERELNQREIHEKASYESEIDKIFSY